MSGAWWARVEVTAELPPERTARVELHRPGGAAQVKPADLAVEDLVVGLLANQE
jgi:hypothetical protein